MIQISTILGHFHEDSHKQKISVPYEWFETEKGRILKTAEDGTEFGIAVAGGVRDGDILYETETLLYVVTLTASQLISISYHNAQEAARIGFELGNRHLSLKIRDRDILVPYDEPTCLYLQKLGFEAVPVCENFSDYIQCRAHGAAPHTHHHVHEAADA